MTWRVFTDPGYIIGSGIRPGEPIPITQMDLISNLFLQRGVGPATFTRSTTGTFVDKDDGLVTTAAIDAARFEANGLLIEGASSNIALPSEDFSTVWVALGGSSITTNQFTAPDGANSADKLTTNGFNQSIKQTFTMALEVNTFTFSMYAFLDTGSPTVGSDIILDCFGSSITSSITQIGTVINGNFARFEATLITNGVGTDLSCQLRSDITATSGIWGGMLEPLPFSSSYIKTIASPVSRDKDTLSYDAANIPPPTENYTVSMEVDVLGLDPTKTFTVYSVDGETSRKCVINTTTGLIEATHGAVTVTSTTVMVPGINPEIKVAVGDTNITLFVNGVQEAQAVKGTVTGTATAISIGNASGLDQIYGHVKLFKIFDRVA